MCMLICVALYDTVGIQVPWLIALGHLLQISRIAFNPTVIAAVLKVSEMRRGKKSKDKNRNIRNRIVEGGERRRKIAEKEGTGRGGRTKNWKQRWTKNNLMAKE